MSGFSSEDVEAVRVSGLFDTEWYLKTYPDVKALGIDPIEHYLWLGAMLKRDPSARFSGLATHLSVGAAGINPLLHYVRTRAKEKRVLEALSPDEMLRLCEGFDSGYYLRENPDLGISAAEAFEHYLTIGWRQGRDPSPHFCTSHYLDNAPDIQKAGINPLVHYVRYGMVEKRATLPFHRRLALMDYSPTVTAIVPNYNHERFLEKRIDSMLNQTYPNVEIIIIDDCSTDGSRGLIARYCERYPERVRAILNSTNSGNVFKQWRKGIERATGDLVWICESDDFCESDFLERLIPTFKDRSVNIAFGRIQFCDAEGHLQPGLDAYRESAEAGIWEKPLTRPACSWFTRGFGVNNIIANVGGCIFRRQSLSETVWAEAETYTVLGDWFLYCHLAGGGQIAYEPAAVAYFRQHGKNTSVSSFLKAPYYQEHQRLMRLLTSRWSLPVETIDRFVSKVAFQYRHLNLASELGPFEKHIRADELKAPRPRMPHILMAFLGFHIGGGETFPINLANALHEKGMLVSMLALDMTEVNPGVQSFLNPAIPVYDAGYVQDLGLDRFLTQADIALIHSHMLSLEWFFFEQCRMKTRTPYLVTLHGSYEAANVSGDGLRRIVESTSHFVYTAEKNLEPFRGLTLPHDQFSYIANGMPEDTRPFPLTRQDLGIPADAVVFAFAARGIKRKGWRASIEAFIRLRDKFPHQPMSLLLAGEGEEMEQNKIRYNGERGVAFLGYQSHIHGLYRLADCALVPSRFAGESFPMCIMQAMQSGAPVISSRVGNIPTMLGSEQPAGILIDPERDTGRFIDLLTDAMAEMLDPERRRTLAEGALARARTFDIAACADNYISLYSRLLGVRADKDDYFDAEQTWLSHIGANKTGSSAIQRYSAMNHPALRENGFIVPDAECGPGTNITGCKVF